MTKRGPTGAQAASPEPTVQYDVVALDAIRVPPDRLRRDLGDLDALVASIAARGLIHPLTIDRNNELVVGLRRFTAISRLEWTTVTVRRVGVLSASERLAVEIEENSERDDIRGLDRERMLVRLGRAVEDEAKRKKCAASAQSRRKPGSLRDVAARLGVPESTYRSAKAIVSAAEYYPELCSLPVYQIVDAATALDALPLDERPAWLERITVADAPGRVVWPLCEEVRQRERAASAGRAADAQAAAQSSTPATGQPAVAVGAASRPAAAPDPVAATAAGSRAALRRRYLVFEQQGDWALEVQPRTIIQALERSDLKGAARFIDKLVVWAVSFQTELRR